MIENKKVSKCVVCVINCFIVELGMNVICVCVVVLVFFYIFEVLRLLDIVIGLLCLGNVVFFC